MKDASAARLGASFDHGHERDSQVEGWFRMAGSSEDLGELFEQSQHARGWETRRPGTHGGRLLDADR